MKWLLLLLSYCYGFVVQFRLLLFNSRMLKKHSFSIPVVSVGNISVGGTGKTPAIILLSNLLQKNDKPHVIISRGYKKTKKGTIVVRDTERLFVKNPEQVGDEAFLLAKKLIGVPIIVDEKKQRAIKLAINLFNPEIILVDDGFQSHYISRNLDIVLLDVSMPLKQYRLMPLGALREDMNSLKRADCVVFVNKNTGSNNLDVSIIKTLKHLQIPTVKASFQYKLFYYDSVQGELVLAPKGTLGIPVVAVSGIGNASSFNSVLLKYFSNIQNTYNFTDHYNYKKNQKKFFALLNTEISKNNCAGLVTTFKDFVKIISLFKNMDASLETSSFKLYVLDMQMAFIDKEALIENKVLGLLRRKG